jgi:tetratricopeptide (TPR) repeat protein
LLNPKHYLGNAYLKAGRTKDAKDILQEDLLNNQENGWALFGIWQALTAEKKKTEANKVLLRFNKAFNKADLKLYGSVSDHAIGFQKQSSFFPCMYQF